MFYIPVRLLKRGRDMDTDPLVDGNLPRRARYHYWKIHLQVDAARPSR